MFHDRSALTLQLEFEFAGTLRIQYHTHTIKYADKRPLAGTQIPILDGVPVLIPSRGRPHVWLKSQCVGHDPIGSGDYVGGGLGLERFTECVL